DAIVAEKFAAGSLRVPDSVGMKHDHVARVQNKAALVVGGFLENSQRKTGEPDFFAVAAVIKERLLLPGIGHAKLAPSAMPGGETERHEAAFDHALAEKAVDGVQHFRRAVLLGRKAAQRADSHGAVERGRASLPAHIA